MKELLNAALFEQEAIFDSKIIPFYRPYTYVIREYQFIL